MVISLSSKYPLNKIRSMEKAAPMSKAGNSAEGSILRLLFKSIISRRWENCRNLASLAPFCFL